MNQLTRAQVDALALPQALQDWIGGAALHDSSGQSGAITLYVDRAPGAYLKIAPAGVLQRAATMQAYFAARGLSAPVLLSLPADRDYLLVEALPGKDGTHPRHLAQGERLAGVFGEALRALHAVDAAGCPIRDGLDRLARQAAGGTFLQSHLDDISAYIGPARAEDAAREIAAGIGLLRHDVLMHGDYCLPNIMLEGWRPTGFIDVVEGGLGDRHYDLVWGLWTLNWNLKSQRFGARFLDAYGRDAIDEGRLRLCGLLASLD